MCNFIRYRNTHKANVLLLLLLIGCNTAARGLTDIYARSRGRAAPEGECGYISKTPSMSMLRLCNISIVVYGIARN